MNSRARANDKIGEALKDLMDSPKEIDGKNYVEKFTQPQPEISRNFP